MLTKFWSDIDDWTVEDLPFVPYIGMEIKYDFRIYTVEKVVYDCKPYANEIHVYLDVK